MENKNFGSPDRRGSDNSMLMTAQLKKELEDLMFGDAESDK